MNSETIGTRLDEGGGVGQGFDALRLILACSVVLYHSFGVAAAREFVGHWQILAEAIVPAFFVLSGFLVTASGLRSTLLQFVINRAVRILPALIAVVVLSALVLGPILTTLDLATYFAAPETRAYFLSILGDAQMELPGVFMGSHVEGATHAHLHAEGTFNVSLWTIGWEMVCYAIVALLIAARLLARRTLVLSLFVAIMAFRLGLYIAQPHVIHVQTVELGPMIFPGIDMHNLHADHSLAPHSPDWFTNRLALHLTSWEFRVIPFFMAGMLCYLWRHDLYRKRGVALASAGVLVLVSLTFPGQESTPVTNLLTAAPIAYLVGFIGTANLRLPGFIKGDYSYGVYLWAFPIQQMFHMSGLDGGSPWANTLLTLPVALLAGCLSWHLIEWPVLATRKSIRRKASTVDISSIP